MEPGTGRDAQRRRTRRAILDAAARLLAEGASPSVGEIADAAEVSRRTVYLHFPTLDQLVLDAVVGTLSTSVDEALAAAPDDDVHARLAALVDGVTATMGSSLALGRRLIALTVAETGREEGAPRRGHRRVAWIESALEPVRDRLGREAFADLVSALAVVVGWEAFIVLTDVRGLGPDEAGAVSRRAAHRLFDAALADAAGGV
ncbi:TetR/AcrR family transcriptional regulator [Actinomycetospora sp. TBRC 11914]|uniref:TetR/AcrR family transcriptional regulator n=1 Tax=Actinomycetospora sp. TBRC 11914 TaxID=2729387 RepID=UPI00145DF1D9|nr:TetR/AcrR family transcriptional regulator [Actinomycetospora sp. TBRC 11914]NMO88742.1 TetR/AcrR family transcriptional regulator [Actinomycetospora sp. TBRC 11914]